MYSRMYIGRVRGKVLLAAALLVLPLYACAQPGAMSDEYRYGPGWGMHPGMMGGYGYGPGAGPGWERGGYGPGWGMGRGGYGPGYGMGPGMMGGYGPGWGPMGYGMGPGMGPGMMGGYGWGPGGMGPMMGFGFGPGMLYGLDLSEEQRERIRDIQGQVYDRHSETQRELFDQQARLHELYRAERLDPKQVAEVYGTIGTLRQQMAQEAAEAHNRVLDVLSEAQRAQLRQWRNSAYGAGPGPRSRR